MEDPKDVTAVAAFLTTAVVITGLMAQLRATQTLRESEKALKEAEARKPQTPAEREAQERRQREAERRNGTRSETVTIPQT